MVYIVLLSFFTREFTAISFPVTLPLIVCLLQIHNRGYQGWIKNKEQKKKKKKKKKILKKKKKKKKKKKNLFTYLNMMFRN